MLAQVNSHFRVWKKKQLDFEISPFFFSIIKLGSASRCYSALSFWLSFRDQIYFYSSRLRLLGCLRGSKMKIWFQEIKAAILNRWKMSRGLLFVYCDSSTKDDKTLLNNFEKQNNKRLWCIFFSQSGNKLHHHPARSFPNDRSNNSIKNMIYSYESKTDLNAGSQILHLSSEVTQVVSSHQIIILIYFVWLECTVVRMNRNESTPSN